MNAPRHINCLPGACSEGHVDIVDSLLESGVDLNTRIQGDYPLHRVCIGTEIYIPIKPDPDAPGNRDILQQRACAGVESIFYWDAFDVVAKLIAHGADVDLENYMYLNALACALDNSNFQPRVAQLVLDHSKHGVNRINGKLNYLWDARNLEAVKFLVENGININHVANYGTDHCTYLDHCKQNDDNRKFDYLRSVGAKLYSEL